MLDVRIEQFRKMAQDDPDNEMGHFSLGKALIDAGREVEAIPSLQRVLELNTGYSKAYQFLAQAQIASGQKDDAVATLQRGFEIATERGDRMPAQAMAQLLETLGEAIPKVASPPHAAGPEVEGFTCKRCGSHADPLDEQPMRGPSGEQIKDHICQPCWREWLAMGVKVINELRLPLHTKEGQESFDQHMKEFLNLDGT